MPSSRNQRPLEVSSGSAGRPAMGRTKREAPSGVQIAGSSHLIEALHATATYGQRVRTCLSGRSRRNPEVTPTAARTE
jgi:hypothetical protein